MTEDRRQRTEDRRQKTEDRRQKTEDRHLTFLTSDLKLGLIGFVLFEPEGGIIFIILL
ncbi:MAG: hypothetical protein IIC00_16060 [Planctomycetes bacterium]|nr:hypothetical protein [Planctomycetota bacterium]